MTGPRLFISDLHLSPARPAISQAFFAFLHEEACRAQALYILGDLFDYWVGDDDLTDPFNASVAASLRELVDTGHMVFFMPGNRDFLMDARFASATGMQILVDPTPIDLFGTPTLLMHGDTLCTADLAYQEFRAKVHDSDWQRHFLAKPLLERRAIALGLRQESQTEQGAKSADIMDVTPGAVEQAFRDYRCDRIIHGHTHRPDHHRYVIDGRPCERWVLGAWYDAGSYLSCGQSSGCVPKQLGGT